MTVGNQKRNRGRRAPDSPPYRTMIQLGVHGLTDEHRHMLTDPARARAVFADHPAVGLGARTDTPAGTATVSSFGTPGASSATTEQLPLLLLETRHAIHWHAPGHGQVEAQVQAICHQGFTLWSGPLVALLRVPGWTLRRPALDRLELHGPGGRWAHTTLTPDPEWLSAAASQHDVLVIYGPALGVEIDPALVEPTDNGRRGELDDYRRIGYVAAGIVEFQP